MASKKAKITGKLYWVKLGPDNLDTGYQEAWADNPRSSLNMDLTEDQYKKLVKAGSGKQKKESSDNPDLIRISIDRPWESPDWDTAGKLGGRPTIVFKDSGRAWDEIEDGDIGNGTEAEVVVTVYSTRMPGRNGTRLDKILITDLVLYEPDEEDDPEDEAEDTPPPKKGTRNKKREDLDDEIPF